MRAVPARPFMSRMSRLIRWHTLRSTRELTTAKMAGTLGILALSASSAIVFKELQARLPSDIAPLAMILSEPTAAAAERGAALPAEEGTEAKPADLTSGNENASFLSATDLASADALEPGLPIEPLKLVASFDSLTLSPELTTPAKQWPADTRWFNGRPVRPVRIMQMVVTAYSPDARSCGDSADGITASLHSVETNAGRLVAADPKVLPMGSMVSIPGYDAARIVPVLDVGGAIKGNRLDVLFATHEAARQFGRRTIAVTVWGYADGAGKTDWRKIRDSR